MTLTGRVLACGWAALLAVAAPAAAQETVQRELRESQLRLDQIRREREELQQQMERLRTRVRSVAGELANIERQRSASAGALREIEFQQKALAGNIDAINGELAKTRARLEQRNNVMAGRLRSIYKRGPLHAVRVLLTAESFGDLLNRYKYLHLVSSYDQVLLDEVGRLERELLAQGGELKDNLAQLQELRAEKASEFTQLQQLETEHARALNAVRREERQAEGRLAQIAKDETRLTGLIGDLERKRREEDRRRVIAGGQPAAEAATLSTRDLGSLGWPVEGELIYRFGPERRPNGVVLRWNGIGIAAPTGTPVRVVEAGTVAMAGNFEGYGPTVIVSHGGGFYTSYHYLGAIQVREGQRVGARQVIGTVGGQRTPEGPHIEFQVRAPTRGGLPEPVDPLGWLRERARG
ncbi:MAG: peptidoglycan DD-metalloendopeptidase family protein [Gemmatimonadetes bacterium]|nr:peptidoglycan DD-metalloendopeptidase family protein [Gemmatimonadota bacterium]